MTAYGFSIWPCSDMSNWEHVNGPEVKPPVYEKKVGRPPKSRRKQPHEVQGKHGPKLSKHGVIITCSYCLQENHNRAGCPFRKLGINPEEITSNAPLFEEVSVEETVITQDVPVQGGEKLLSQHSSTMLSQMFTEFSQTSRVVQQHEPLPESIFIMSNKPSARPVPITTVTKKGRARIQKRKAPTDKTSTTTTAKKRIGGRAKKNAAAANANASA